MQIKQLMSAVSLALCGILLWAPFATAATYMYDKTDTLTSPVSENDKQWLPTVAAVTGNALSIGGKSAVLLEQQSGKILFEKASHEKLPIASVTKIMTLLLTMEALDGGLIKYDDKVTCSATAASMGGSQIWLEQGETMTVDELLKAVAVVSANDASAALAEHLCGTIENFVARMNERANELGMQDTKFLDCSGLNDEAYSSAHDVAVMARQLMMHEGVQKYTTIWMDSLRDGKSQLVNTNKLVRHYNGATGLKTGTTQKAGHCLAATAKRGDIAFVAVILGCENTDERFGGARAMLDYGFANFSLFTPTLPPDAQQQVAVTHGKQDTVTVKADNTAPILLKKGQDKQVTSIVELAESIKAPVEQGQILGTWRLQCGEEVLCEIPLRAAQNVGKMTVGSAFLVLLQSLIGQSA